MAEADEARSRWALSRSEMIWYSVAVVLALLVDILGLRLVFGMTGMPQPALIPFWPFVLVVIAAVYLVKRRRRTPEHERSDAFFDSERPPS